MTRNEEHQMQDIDTLLDDMRRDLPNVPAALTERVMMDAERLQPMPRREPKPKVALRGLLEAMGGWPALGGLAAASCMGFWIGISPPQNVLDPAGLFLPLETEAYYDPAELTGFGWDVQEGL